MNKTELQREIEACRKEMVKLSGEYGLTADIVVQTSTHLDQLLNRYQTFCRTV